jgi:hypothetical protein
MRQQRNDQHDRHWVCPQTVEDTASGGTKGFVTHLALIPLFLLTVDRDVATPTLASCHTLQIGAKYSLWVHRLHSWHWFRNHQVWPVNPFSSNPLPLSAQARFNPELPKIDLVDEMPISLWMAAAPNEYGFYANVNPDVPHPRWSQASERRIGETKRRKTLPFNGYAEEVARLYEGMDLRVWY